MDWRFQKGGCLKEKWDAIVSRREMDVGKNTVQFRAEIKIRITVWDGLGLGLVLKVNSGFWLGVELGLRLE